ncbi:MAG TPA: TetR/AcrR family transcriptional regulator [Xanthobacteraceae bacterium]|nr:TetR/AcrR family transcriptional regulator [Xanthobacteraceae bacterium]
MVAVQEGIAPARRAGTRDRQRTRAAILKAATQEFAAKGLTGARVDAIARRARVNKRMIYHYFAGKDGLYLAVLEATYAAIRAAELELHLSDRNPVDGMRELVLFTWRYFLAHPEFLSLLGTENLHKAAYLKRSRRIRELHSPLIGMISSLLARGARARVFRAGVDPVELYVTIAALGFFYLSNRHTLSTIFGRDLSAPKSIAAREAHIVDVVLGYLKR